VNNVWKARRSETWLCQRLAALFILTIPQVAALAAESQFLEAHQLLVKHIDPELPETNSDSDNEVVTETTPVPVKHVLIATEASHFKESIATQVAETLAEGKLPLLVKRVDLHKLAAEPIQNYQAIILINSCRAWRPSHEVRDFLKSACAADKKKIVVLTTANSGSCDLGDAGVDAISAASKHANIPGVSQTVINMVRDRLTAK
jgi:hypothetical protein